jgi:hypothetical protein
MADGTLNPIAGENVALRQEQSHLDDVAVRIAQTM